jgi:hypothetical protein
MKKIILRLYAIFIGATLGIFIGVIVFGTALRIMLDVFFHWGDSGPNWVNWIIAIFSLFSTAISIYLAVNWIDSFIERSKKRKQKGDRLLFDGN